MAIQKQDKPKHETGNDGDSDTAPKNHAVSPFKRDSEKGKSNSYFGQRGRPYIENLTEPPILRSHDSS